MRRRLLTLALSAGLMLSLSAPALAYSDTAGHWAESAIQRAADYGLMVGYEDGRFGVADNLNRASFVTILCQMFSWEAVRPGQASFIDCPSSHWAYGYVEAARAHGVVDAGGSFRPDDYISREEMAVMLVKALGYDTLAKSAAADLPFSDVTENQGYISLAYRIGMVSGIEEDGRLLFKPASSATRAEAATMLVQVYERYTSSIEWLHGFYALSSYSQIDLTRQMDAVSVGWARMEYDPQRGAVLNTTGAGDNDWKIPAQSEAATGYFERNGIPYNLCVFGSASDSVTLSDGAAASTVAAVTASPASRAQAVAALAAAASDYAGITIDFEGLKDKNGLKEHFAAFMAELRAALPADKRLYVCVQPGPYNDGFDFKSLGESCDKVILMAHDYRPPVSDLKVGSIPSESFALTPFSKIYAALVEITDPLTGVQDKSKLALAFSMDTTGFRIDEAGRVLESKYYRPAIETLSQRLAQSGTAVTYSQSARNPYAVYTDESGARYQVWFENAQSIADKIDLAQMFGITGFSFWRLGNIPTYDSYNLWTAVQAERP